MLDLDDNSLLVKINGGNHQAFAVLVRRHSKYFYAIAYRFIGHKQTAEDIVQQALLKLWEFPYKYQPDRGASFKTWFSRIIINLCIDYKRKHFAFFEDIEETEIESKEDEAHLSVYKKELKQSLEKAINKLPASQQKALNLGLYQEIAYEEVAKIMKTTTSAVKSLIMRAKENIKKDMENVREKI